jgi:hypothetical protein
VTAELLKEPAGVPFSNTKTLIVGSTKLDLALQRLDIAESTLHKLRNSNLYDCRLPQYPELPNLIRSVIT